LSSRQLVGKSPWIETRSFSTTVVALVVSQGRYVTAFLSWTSTLPTSEFEAWFVVV
jgi:hypothetical protein